MASIFSKIKSGLGLGSDKDVFEEAEKDFVEVNPSGDERPQLMIKTFVLEDFSDIKDVLDVLREGHIIPIINIRPIKEKDLIELKRAINKLKKTCDAIDGDIAGFGEDWVAIAPSFATIYREKHGPAASKPPEEMDEDF